MTLLYIITFGTFSGLAASFGLLIKQFYGSAVFGAEGVSPAQYAFYGRPGRLSRTSPCRPDRRPCRRWPE